MSWIDYLSGFMLGFGIGVWLYNWVVRVGVRQTRREHCAAISFLQEASEELGDQE